MSIFSKKEFTKYAVLTGAALSLLWYNPKAEVQKTEKIIINELNSVDYIRGPSSESEYKEAYENMCDMIKDHLDSQGYDRSLSFEEAAEYAKDNGLFYEAAENMSHTNKEKARNSALKDILWREDNSWKSFDNLGIEIEGLFSKEEKEQIYKNRLDKSIKTGNSKLAQIYAEKLADLNE